MNLTDFRQPGDVTDPFNAASAAALDYMSEIDSRRVAPDRGALEGLGQLAGPMNEEPIDPREIVDLLHKYGSPATVASTGGRYFGLVVGATLPAALAARVLTSAWDQVVFNDATSPVGCALERSAAPWVLDVLKLPAEAHVSFVTGATMATFTCLAAARGALLARAGHDVAQNGLWGAPKLRVVATDEVHVTVVKALNLLGWGKADIERVPTDDQGRLIVDRLPELDSRTVICVQAGNVNSGSVDPLDAICARAREAGAWVHVDGAFGLWAAASAKRSMLTKGADLADSWVVDGHKWLNTPYDCGLAIVRDANALHDAMVTQAPYLKPGALLAPKDMAPEFSRSARGVEIWAALRSLGRQGLSDLIDRTCDLAQLLSTGLEAAGYEILNDVVMNQVVARIGTPEQHTQIAQLCQDSGECWFGVTNWQGRSAIRLAVSSWKTTKEDIAQTLAAIGAATMATVGSQAT